MQEPEINEALAILGLEEGASQADIESARRILEAFFKATTNDSNSLQSLSERLTSRVNQTVDTLQKNKAAGTASGATTKDSLLKTALTNSKKDNKSGLFWFFGIAACVGLIAIYSNKQPSPSIRQEEPHLPLHEVPQDVRTGESPSNTNPADPPQYAKSFVHSEIGNLISRWTAETEYISRAKRVVVRGFDSSGRLINELLLYDNNGSLGLDKQYVVRRDNASNTLSVQRFLPTDSPVGVYADRRNVAENGDVHSQTTFYSFDQFGKLLRVQIDTQFIQSFDGLTFDRSSGRLVVKRDKDYGEMDISHNPTWLSNNFDLWNEFGQTN